jgi:hypothetical protein
MEVTVPADRRTRATIPRPFEIIAPKRGALRQTCLAYVLGQALGIGRYVVDDPMYLNHLGCLRIGRVTKTKSSRPPPRRRRRRQQRLLRCVSTERGSIQAIGRAAATTKARHRLHELGDNRSAWRIDGEATASLPIQFDLTEECGSRDLIIGDVVDLELPVWTLRNTKPDAPAVP